jgi:hypothetical protein
MGLDPATWHAERIIGQNANLARWNSARRRHRTRALAILTAPEQTTAARCKMINPYLLPADAGRRTANIRVSVLSGGN